MLGKYRARMAIPVKDRWWIPEIDIKATSNSAISTLLGAELQGSSLYFGYLSRVGFLTLMLALELIVYFRIHIPDAFRDLITHWVLLFVVSVLVIGFPRLHIRVRSICDNSVLAPVSWRFIFLHACALTIFLAVVSPGVTKRFIGEDPL